MVCFVIAIHGNWIPANPRFALPAGMTDFLVLGESFCCSVPRLKLVALFVAIRLQVNYLIDKPKHKLLPLFLRLCGGVCHTILYSLMITQPVLGIGVTNAHNVKVSFLGLGKLPSLLPANSELANTLTHYHSLVAWVLLGAVVLHISAALIHHYVFKDEVLSVMLFDKKDGNFSSMGNGVRNNQKGSFLEGARNKFVPRYLVRLFGKGGI